MKSIRDTASIRVEPLVVSEARQQASAILARAEAQASAMLEAARAECEALRAAVFARAEREASERVVAQYAAVIAAAEREGRASERDIVALALDIARNVLAAELTTSPAAIESIARRALARVRRARSVVLRVNADDRAYALDHAREWLAPGAEPSVFEVVEDASVERGGVVVECDLGRIDARIESQLKAIARALEGA
jgi:flagellar biosynthesis/type III secretory pathway protein FliH